MVATLATALALTGCASSIRVNTTTFQGPRSDMRGDIAVLPSVGNQENSLEFKAVSDYLMTKLVQAGYSPAKDLKNPSYSAFITYGIDDGKTTISSSPIFGQTGGGGSSTFGTVGATNFNSSTYNAPTFGVVGTSTSSNTEYKRVVNIDIFRMDTTPVKVYEMKAISRGSCGNINAVVNLIIDGMFKKFPGENGKSQTVQTDFSSKC